MAFIHEAANPVDHPRRRFLKTMMAAGSSLAVPSVLVHAQDQANGAPRELQFATLDEGLNELTQLTQAGEPVSLTTWNWAQTLTHCAQSIEFSMAGFPQPKSALFQSTVGAAAYEVFAWRGRMTHDLAEPIPGAASLDGITDNAVAEARLRSAVDAFRQWKGEWQPHFAYGELTQAEYELAHAMHLANHFSYFRSAS